MPTLIGHLAQFNSFSRQGELLCTQSLAYLLREPGAAAAFSAHLSTCAGISLPNGLTWRAEVGQVDRGRPDLEACTPDEKPIVKVEAKLGAAISADQLTSYVADLHRRSSAGLLIVLVPSHRRQEALESVRRAFTVDGESPWPLVNWSGSVIAVTFWSDVIEALRAVPSESFGSDLAEFENLYRALNGDDLETPSTPEDLASWQQMEVVYVQLVDRVTRRVKPGGRLLPMGREEYPVSYQRRYVCGALGPQGPCFSVGVRFPFSGFDTPIWMRFHRDTRRFLELRRRLTPPALRVVESGGHVWIPLDIPLGADGRAVEDSLIDQVRDVLQLAFRELA